MRLKFPLEARKHVESWEHVDCLSVAEFVEDDLEYLEFRQELKLTQRKHIDGPEYVPKHGSTIAGPEHYWTATSE